MATDSGSMRRDKLAVWDHKARKIVADRVEDAYGHAWNAITQRSVDATDGRPTQRVIMASRGYRAAMARLDELVDEMAGPGRRSLSGLVRDAKAEFYRESWDLWVIPESVRSQAGPTRSGERSARGLLIDGLDAYDEMLSLIEPAKRHLTSILTSAGETDQSNRSARNMLTVWRTRRESGIMTGVSLLLSGSEVAVFNSVGRLLVAPEYH